MDSALDATRHNCDPPPTRHPSRKSKAASGAPIRLHLSYSDNDENRNLQQYTTNAGCAEARCSVSRFIADYYKAKIVPGAVERLQRSRSANAVDILAGVGGDLDLREKFVADLATFDYRKYITHYQYGQTSCAQPYYASELCSQDEMYKDELRAIIQEKQRLIDCYYAQNVAQNSRIYQMQRALDELNAELNSLKAGKLKQKIAADSITGISPRKRTAREQFLYGLKTYNEKTILTALQSPVKQTSVSTADAEVQTDSCWKTEIQNANPTRIGRSCSVNAELAIKLRAMSRNSRAYSPAISRLETAVRSQASNYNLAFTFSQETAPFYSYKARPEPQGVTSYVLAQNYTNIPKAPTKLFFLAQHLVGVLPAGDIMLDGVFQYRIPGIAAVATKMNRFAIAYYNMIWQFDSVCRLYYRIAIDFPATALDFCPGGYVAASGRNVRILTVADLSFMQVTLSFPVNALVCLRRNERSVALAFGEAGFAAIDVQTCEKLCVRQCSARNLVSVVQADYTAFLAFENCIQQLVLASFGTTQSLGFKNRIIAIALRGNALYAALHTGEIARFENGDLLLYKRVLVADSCAACAFGIDSVCVQTLGGANKSLKWSELY